MNTLSPVHVCAVLALCVALTPPARADGAADSSAGHDCLIEPRQLLEIRPAAEGLISRIHVRRGDRVTAGQPLIELDSALERASVAAARFRAGLQSPIHSAETRVEFAGAKARRHEQLAAVRYVSPQERDEAASGYRLAQVELDDARDNQRLALLELARLEEQLRQRTVLSPVDGIVIDRLMHPGELADNRDLRKPVLKIADLGTLYVEVLVPIREWRNIRPGQMATVLPEPAVGGRYEATVLSVDPVFDAASGTFGVRLELPNPDFALPAGIKCQARFEPVDPPAAPGGSPGTRSMLSASTQ